LTFGEEQAARYKCCRLLPCGRSSAIGEAGIHKTAERTNSLKKIDILVIKDKRKQGIINKVLMDKHTAEKTTNARIEHTQTNMCTHNQQIAGKNAAFVNNRN